MAPILGMLVVWWLLTATLLQSPRIYPTPLDVGEELVRILSGEGPIGSTYTHMWATFIRVIIAFAIAYVLGTLLGVVAGRLKWVFDFSTSLVWIAFAVPSVVWVFIFLTVLGISNLVPVMALVVLLSAPVFIGTAEGVKAVPKELIAMTESYRISTFHRFTGLYLPSILPYMMSNARISFAFGVKIVLVAEVVGLPDGIGLLVRYWSDRLYMAPVVAWGLILVVLGLVVDTFILGYFERRAKLWAGDQTSTAPPTVGR